MPKTQRKEKIRERKEIPSFAALSDELTKLRIQEFMNPRQNQDFHSEVLTPCVDAKKEQRKVVFTRIQRAARLEGKISQIKIFFIVKSNARLRVVSAES